LSRRRKDLSADNHLESVREVSMREAILIALTFAMFSMAATVITLALIRP